MKRIIINDFDGTINRFDIGNKITKSLLTTEDYKLIDRVYKNRKISNYEIYERYLAPIISKDGHNLSSIINKYLHQTNGFVNFFNFAKKQDYDLLILSDGFDIYISAFLKKYNIDIPYFANRVIKTEEGYSLIFPNKKPHCERCGTCKEDIIKNLRRKYNEIIYIGDGLSDICPSSWADVFFGKRKIFKEINVGKKFYFYDYDRLKDLLQKKGNYRAVIFDLDGTLVDGFDIIYESFNYSLKTLGLKEIPIREIKKVIGPALSEGFRRLVPEHLVAEGVNLYRSYYKERYLERTILFDGVRELLKYLKDMKIIVGLITNKKVSFAEELLRYLKIDKFFDFVNGAEEGYLPKPDSEIMEKIMKEFKINKEETIYIGDSEIDGKFANNCGVDFIALGLGLSSEGNLYKHRPLTYLKDMKSVLNSLTFLFN